MFGSLFFALKDMGGLKEGTRGSRVSREDRGVNDDIDAAMTDVIRTENTLTSEDRHLLQIAFKNSAHARRMSRRSI